MVEDRGTLLLGFTKLNRRTQGHTSTDKRKPQKYQRSTRVFFYNLGDEQHVHALLHTFQHLAAMAAGIKEKPTHSQYRLKIGDRRALSKAPLLLKNDAVDDVNFDGQELLELLCENANYRNPSNRVHALDPEIRERAQAQWRAACTKKERVTFRIRSTLSRQDEEMRAYALNDASELTIPLEAVEGLVDAVRELLLFLWSYLGRHPEQTDRRYEGPAARWQLHRLIPVDAVLLPRIHEVFAFQEEPALFEHRELYNAHIPRLRRDTENPALQDFHPLHVRRLAAYEAQRLHWSCLWKVSEWQAQEDLLRVKQLLHAGVLRRLREVVRCLILTMLVKRKRRQTKRGTVVHGASMPPPLAHVLQVELRSRGPPPQS